MDEVAVYTKKKTLTQMQQRPSVSIEFQDVTYTVPVGRKGSKLILRSISGQFRSGHLNAILGPSGAGKTTLLNILAGYKTIGATGSITINGEPRNLKQFRKMSRYIMQQDLLQPMLTVQESMVMAADFKLSRDVPRENKLIAISEILDMLRLTPAKDTKTDKLSGGEKKRLSIALELLNNPPVIFLDEPTTGLDDSACSQCISLLKLLAEGGRTVVCSLHTPSARLFSMFDNVYIVSSGQCVYQGYGPDIVPFLENLGISCPKHYNPADFVIEVCSGEYGEFSDRMVTAVDNGRSTHYCKKNEILFDEVAAESDTNTSYVKALPYSPTTTSVKPRDMYKSSAWVQFKILLYRFWLQTFRDSSYLLLRAVLYLFLGVFLGAFYLDMGNDGSKTLFNFGFCFTSVIAFMYVPMMPVLLKFPLQIQLLKREYFNRWYGLGAYFCALSVCTLSLQFVLGSLFVGIAYVLTGQPLELDRIVMFFSVCTLTAFTSESLGLIVSSTLNILNGMFIGPVLSCPLILLAVYGVGQGTNIPVLIKLAMHFSYLRYALEGLIVAVYGGDRDKLPCPEEELFCQYTDPKYFMSIMGMENCSFWVTLGALISFFVVFRIVGFYLLRQRLRPNKTFAALQVIGRIVKSHFSLSR